MNSQVSHPEPFLIVRVHDLDAYPQLVALCAGYELNTWRRDQLVDHIFEWLPEFALKYSEWQSLGPHNAIRLVRKAARAIYQSTKFERRGEFGELLLHIAIRQTFKTLPAISKLYYKDAPNDTVKGFDCVHVVVGNEDLQLWIGESKFYSDIYSAIADVVAELKEHSKRDYLRTEFSAIMNKIDDNWPYSARLKKLLDENTSLDEIFSQICIPVFLTYDSATIIKHSEVTEDFKTEFEKEVRHYRNIFAGKELPDELTIHLFLLPLHKKSELQAALDQELRKWN